MSLSDAAGAINARHLGVGAVFSGVSTDSRSVQRDELFVALKGERFDGHDYLDEAASRGAVGVMVSRPVDIALGQLVVDDTRLGLGRLAAAWRADLQIPVIAVTGSNGKTTVKEMIASIMAGRGEVLATHGNLNNDIGVPLTLLRLRDTHQSAVIEMGANHAGEIAYVTALARPTVAMITNAGPAHLEGFGSLDGVAHAKAEIFTGLGATGTAVLNADDAYYPLWKHLTRHYRQLSFAIDATADMHADAKSIVVTGDGETQRTQFTLHTPAGSIDVSLPMPGRHNVMNALGAAAAAFAAGAEPEDIRRGLAAATSVGGRMQSRPGLHGARLIDDTYNANPASLQAGLSVLTALPGRHWLMLGDMGELGDDAAAAHEIAGQAARAAGIERLFTLGDLASHAAAAFGAGATHFDTIEDLIQALRFDLAHGITLLIKGSRLMRLERVVAAVADPHDTQSKAGVAH
jgi:UDP-N-acetylmuramoyl-tripeptide--D-alanyl-D-alanine ligase